MGNEIFSSLKQNFKSDNASSNNLKSSAWNTFFLKVRQQCNTILYFNKSKNTSKTFIQWRFQFLLICNSLFHQSQLEIWSVTVVLFTKSMELPMTLTTPWCTTSGSCQSTSSQIPRTCCKGVTLTNYTSAPTSCHASVNPGTYKRVTAF